MDRPWINHWTNERKADLISRLLIQKVKMFAKATPFNIGDIRRGQKILCELGIRV
jgi:hypothetical protein